MVLKNLKGKIFMVSIPYRHAKNNVEEKILLRILFVFQFLIGTLKTYNKFSNILNEIRFQFLIGTLKTL